MTTLLLAPDQLDGASVEIVGPTYHHFFRVRRLARGDRLRLVDGAGRARWGEVTAVSSTSAHVELGEAAPSAEPQRRVELFVAAPRPERAAWLVEKTTELGVAAIRFIAAERDPRGVSESQLARLGRVAAAALEQCGRSALPAISAGHRLADLPRLLTGLSHRLVLDPSGESWPPAEAAAGLALFVGPEGGFTRSELTAILALGASAVSLGERLVRVETAAVAGVVLALSRARFR